MTVYPPAFHIAQAVGLTGAAWLSGTPALHLSSSTSKSTNNSFK